MRFLVVASGLSIAVLAPAFAQTPKPSVQLVPHRAVYDLSLLRPEIPRSSTARRGRIAMDFGGDACDGYTMKYRQVTILDSNEPAPDTSTPRPRPSRPATASRCASRSTSTTQGMSRRRRRWRCQALRRRVARRASSSSRSSEVFAAAGEPIFPTEHMKRLIEAAGPGDNTSRREGL